MHTYLFVLLYVVIVTLPHSQLPPNPTRLVRSGHQGTGRYDVDRAVV